MTKQATRKRYEPLFDTAELSQYLSVDRSTLYGWRYEGLGPLWHRIGGRIKYRKEDVDAWVQEQKEKELDRRDGRTNP
jgi:predicted DNA-binding transcriptional regulator AlpA